MQWPVAAVMSMPNIAAAITLRTFLWARSAPPQKCPCPNCRGDGYMIVSGVKVKEETYLQTRSPNG
jgi:hypothetical protein